MQNIYMGVVQKQYSAGYALRISYKARGTLWLWILTFRPRVWPFQAQFGQIALSLALFTLKEQSCPRPPVPKDKRIYFFI